MYVWHILTSFSKGRLAITRLESRVMPKKVMTLVGPSILCAAKGTFNSENSPVSACRSQGLPTEGNHKDNELSSYNLYNLPKIQ